MQPPRHTVLGALHGLVVAEDRADVLREVAVLCGALGVDPPTEQSAGSYDIARDDRRGPRAPADMDTLWTVEDVAAYLNVGVSTAYKLRSEHPSFPDPVRLSARAIRFRPEQIVEWTRHLQSVDDAPGGASRGRMKSVRAGSG